MNSVSLKFDSENWYPVYTKEIEVVIDKYTYLTIDNVSLYLNKINPEGYIKWYRSKNGYWKKYSSFKQKNIERYTWRLC